MGTVIVPQASEKKWKQPGYWLGWTMVTAIVLVWGGMLGSMFFRWYNERACADPNAWAQKSFGRAIAECAALGEGCELQARVYSKSLECTCTQTIKVRP